MLTRVVGAAHAGKVSRTHDLPPRPSRRHSLTLSPLSHSQRSKTKRHFRAVKREDPKSAFKLAEDIRLARLNAKLKQSSLKPRQLTDKEEWEREQAGYETVEGEDDGEGKEGEAKEEQKDGGEFFASDCAGTVRRTCRGIRVQLDANVAIHRLAPGPCHARSAIPYPRRHGRRRDRRILCAQTQDLDFWPAHVAPRGIQVVQGFHRQADASDALSRAWRE